MKYSVNLTREDGKTVLLAANEYIDIDIKAGQRYIARLTVRDEKVYDQADHDIAAPRNTEDDWNTADTEGVTNR